MGILQDNRIYLDNAATTFPKPASVTEEVVKCMKNYCGNAGRGSHYFSRTTSEMIYETRELLARLFGSSSPENVIFTFNTTYALNIAIKSLVKKGMHVLISDMEHNSVLRPIENLAQNNIIEYSVFATSLYDEDGIIKNIDKMVKSNTGMLVCQYASNICGTLLPIKRIGELCRKRGIYFIVDAAQSAGLFDVDIKQLGISALCLPSHKGLMGPQGIGVIVFSDSVGDIGNLSTLIEGGSGSSSHDMLMPDYLPDRFEAGTLSAPVIAGLKKGVQFVIGNTPSDIRSYEEQLAKVFKSELLNMRGVKVYRPELPSSIVLFNILDKSSVWVSDKLDSSGICTRSGFHCAPLAHRALMTGESGAVRVSFGCFNDIKHAVAAADSIYRIIKTAHE